MRPHHKRQEQVDLDLTCEEEDGQGEEAEDVAAPPPSLPSFRPDSPADTEASARDWLNTPEPSPLKAGNGPIQGHLVTFIKPESPLGLYKKNTLKKTFFKNTVFFSVF